MKTRNLIIAVLVVVCFTPLLLSMIPGSSSFQQEKETRNVGNFSSVGLAIDADLILKQDRECSVTVEAERHMLDLIVTEVKDGKLRIKYNKWSVPRHERITVYVSMITVDDLALSGSGSIVADGPVKTGELDLAISGSGNIRIDQLTATEVEASISGSGDISVAGPATVNEMEIGISGSGDVDAEQLEVNNMEVAISGSGDCKVRVTGFLKAAVSGSGNIYCTGNPQVDARVSGSGKVITQ